MRTQIRWLESEIKLIEDALIEIQEGKTIYSQIKLLKNDELNYRTWESIRSKIDLIRRQKNGTYRIDRINQQTID